MARLLLILPLLLAQLVFISCERKVPAPPGAVAAAKPSPRLVILSPALAIIARDLHVKAPIVGRHAWDMVLDKSIPVCGDQAGIDYEALLKARPTHILIEWGQRELPQRLSALAAEHGWQISNYAMLTLADIRDTTRRLYDLLILDPQFAPPPTSAALPTRWERSAIALDMDRAWSTRPSAAAIAAAGRVLILETVNPAHALGPGSFHHQILRAIGGRPVPETGSPYIEMDAEDILSLAPDAIILIEPRGVDAPIRDDLDTWEGVSTRLGPLARLDIPAVKNRRVAVIDDPLALTPSTAMIRLADELARRLEAWGKPP